MRIQHWLTAFMSLLAPMVVTVTAFAQSTPSPQGYPPGSATPGRAQVRQTAAQLPDSTTARTPMVPPVFQPAFATNNPAVLYPPGTPNTMAPWPAITPHLPANVLQDRTYQRDGQWLNEIIYRDPKFYGSIEYLRIHFDGPGGAYIGSKPANINRITEDFPDVITWPFGAPPEDGFNPPLGPGAYPFVFLQEEPEDFVGTATIDPNLFPIRKMSIFDDDLKSNGTRLRFGYMDNDGTGLGAEIWWGMQADERFQMGQSHINGIPITQDLIAGVDLSAIPLDELPDEFDNPGGGFIPFTRVGAVPYEESSGVIDTLFPGSGFTGSTMKYDILYQVDIATQAGGGNVNLYLGDIYKRRSVQIKSYVSARYLYVDEYFRFRGIDSGFGYEIEEEDDDEAPTFRPEDGTVSGPYYPLFETIVQSENTSHLAGPEIGLRGDLGRGKGFHVWWQGSVGLLVNHENLRVHGVNAGNAHFFNTNIGDPTDPSDDTGFGSLFGPAFDMFSNDTTFDDEESHTHVSPMLQLGINAEVDILGNLPLIRRIPLVEAANLTFGYNLLVVGELARPADTIRWRGFPDFPSVRTRRDTWEMHQGSIGLIFER